MFTTIEYVLPLLQKGGYDVIFIDPLSLGLDKTTQFILNLRKEFPKIAVVLFVNLQVVHNYEQAFYAGERSRFKHYFKLDNNPSLLHTLPKRTIDVLLECEAYLEKLEGEDTPRKNEPR